MSTLVYGILWVLCRCLSALFLRYRTKGTGYIPRKGGVLLAANHASYADIPLLGCGVWRRLFYVGRANLFPNRIINWIIRSLGWIPLRTERWDRKAFQQVIELLNAGKAVVIFPEGTRTPDGTLQPGKPGIGMIVAETQCPVIPVYLHGTYEVLPTGASMLRPHPVSVTFGQPIDFRQDKERLEGKALYKQISQTVMDRIADLRGVGQSATPAL
ncbi:lysophospholipid acyltransferase family protein [Candidatus Nitronereus thalassa]|uniref:Lysophospholipid acyltransferase family protein n=1 Tax=Candidatus Nitronereus thalassa TaxID=3020898 RepID=A0ABU3K9V0_9BACT|nr:lysophospholipid acyltransferase family protein [Candidatus Nitronereus thalassa]MDT7043147.1 lysophospholipid acyltransferase family protein [Candidatus Nitronereus thalassa]